MRTRQGRRMRGVCAGLVGLAVTLGMAGTSAAQTAAVISSTEPANLLVFPKIVVDTTGSGLGTTVQMDTFIQITNTDDNTADTSPADGIMDGARRVHCFWVDATGRCVGGSRDGLACRDVEDCPGGGVCGARWAQTDFTFRLTPEQTIGFYASQGASVPCDSPGECRDLADGSIPPVPTDPFRGELKCFEVADDGSDIPLTTNSLLGKATIIRVSSGAIDSSSYNAVGVQVDDGTPGTADPDDPVCLGDPVGGENCQRVYAGCPAVLTLDHYFEGAQFRVNGSQVSTRLTLVPCSQNLNLGAIGAGETTPITAPGPQRCVGGTAAGAICTSNADCSGGGSCVQFPIITTTTAQMLIYNEFEQRFSTFERVTCWDDRALADIDTTPGSSDDAFSIFSVGVQGTLTGQTRIRGVETGEVSVGHGLLAVAEQVHTSGGSFAGAAAYHLGMEGTRAQNDKVCPGIFGSQCQVP